MENEELLILDQITSARIRVAEIKQGMVAVKMELNQAEKILADSEQAAMDYMLCNGLIETEHFRLTENYSVDVPDIKSVPSEFIRTKEEVNKAAIRAMKPQGNWYTLEKSISLTAKELKK